MVNSLIFQGRLTADPEIKIVSNDIKFCEFTVAWSEKYKEKETKCFLRCKAWRNTAEFLERFFTKGSELIVEGRLVTEEWEKDGEKKSRTILDVSRVHFCGKKSDNAQAAATPVNGFIPMTEEELDEIPF